MSDKINNTIRRIKNDVQQLKDVIKQAVPSIDTTSRMQKTNAIIQQIRQDIRTLQQIIDDVTHPSSHADN